MDVRSESFEHRPVMVERITALFAEVPEGTIVDATVGAGGHAGAILAEHPGVQVLGIDQDPDALEATADALMGFADRFQLERDRFDHLRAVVERNEARPVTGVLFDLGVSSPQLDRPGRGFSYRQDGPLDMRMDPDGMLSAADVVNTYAAERLAEILQTNADERFARRIAAAIVANRPVTSTVQLAEIVRDAVPAATRRTGGHPAKRSFQAIRIEVNGELTILARAIDDAIAVLEPGGRVAVLSYHSGEDRIVKRRLAEAASGGCTCPPKLPCGCGATPSVRLLSRGGWTASEQECRKNPRATSARLRAAEKLEVAA